ncbi:MAG TPA: tripartite tricarboxylate transporter permease [Hyphomicrobiaceae bacterium]|nr:tripartite tricarboxylate transporter permease [Hyphomicrobiaceae bacterium]
MLDNVTQLFQGFSVALTFTHIALMFAGVMFGLVVGVMPGLGAPNGVSLLLPLTFAMEPVSAIILLTSMYWGALIGGSTTSILFNIPGEPSSVATTFDGYPMARSGHATRALTYAFMSSGFGALFGVVVVTLLAGAVTRFALLFSPVEYFAVFVLAFASFVAFGGSSPMKTIVSIGMGLAFATVGMDTISGSVRLTYDVQELVRGISFLIVVIGLFGLGELFETMQSPVTAKALTTKLDLRELFDAIRTWPRYWVSLLRSAFIGCWMGVAPGGPTAASFMSYGVAKRASRKPEEFGKGAPDGLVSAETADQAAGSSAMLPMLALGLPSSATAAVLLGGLMIWGITPGPTLFRDNPQFVWGLIASMYLSNVVAVIMALATVPLFARLMQVPFSINGPIIALICIIGAWTVAGAPFDLWLLLIFGVLGFLMKALDYPIAPLVLAMVLGDRTEDAFRQSMLLSGGDALVFFKTPLAASITGLALLFLMMPLVSMLRRRASAA